MEKRKISEAEKALFQEGNINVFIAIIGVIVILIGGYFLSRSFIPVITTPQVAPTQSQDSNQVVPTVMVKQNAQIDWIGLATGKYANQNNIISADNNWMITEYIMGYDPNQALQKNISSSQQATYGNYLTVYPENGNTINGYQVILQYVFVDPKLNSAEKGNEMYAYIFNPKTKKVAQVIGYPPFSDADKMKNSGVINQKLLNQFENIISSFQFPQ